MEGSELDIVEQNTTGTHQFFLFGKKLFFFETVLDFEYPFLSCLRTFKNTNYGTRRYDEGHYPSVVKLIHGPVD